jgi:hypothetical protein
MITKYTQLNNYKTRPLLPCLYILFTTHKKHKLHDTNTKILKKVLLCSLFKKQISSCSLTNLGYVYDPIVSYSPLSNMACINPSIFLRNTRIHSLGVMSNGTVSSPTVDFMDISMLFSMKGI